MLQFISNKKCILREIKSLMMKVGAAAAETFITSCQRRRWKNKFRDDNLDFCSLLKIKSLLHQADSAQPGFALPLSDHTCLSDYLTTPLRAYTHTHTHCTRHAVLCISAQKSCLPLSFSLTLRHTHTTLCFTRLCRRSSGCHGNTSSCPQ